ncbi:MAG: DUF3726 domain-containing protein [Dongiaceae bacterium]
MLCSLNEIDLQVRKAVRGAGYGWGLAEEAGKAARWLSCREFAAVPAFLGLCARFDRSAYEAIAPASPEGVWAAPGGILCPLIAGVTLRDFAPDRMEGGPMAFPIIFAAFAVPAGYALEGGELTAPAVARLTCRRRSQPSRDGAEIAPPPGVTVDDDNWRGIDNFARRTYVPASDVSRRTGAGAGTVVDND